MNHLWTLQFVNDTQNNHAGWELKDHQGSNLSGGLFTARNRAEAIARTVGKSNDHNGKRYIMVNLVSLGDGPTDGFILALRDEK